MIKLLEVEFTLDEKLISDSVNLLICSICLITKIVCIKKYKIKLVKLTLFGLFSMGAALLCCAMIVAGVLLRYYKITTSPTCKIVYISSRALYAVHRAFLYAFVVWRAELVNVWGSIPQVLFRVAKCIVFTGGLFIVGGMILFVETPNSRRKCVMQVNDKVLVVGWTVDVIICVAASYIFLQPLLSSLESHEDKETRNTVKKEAYCITICLLATLATAVLNNLIDGIMEITIGLDCSITTICLLLLSTHLLVTPTNPFDPKIFVRFSAVHLAMIENETTSLEDHFTEMHNVEQYSRASEGRTGLNVLEFREMFNEELDDLFRTYSFDANSDFWRSRSTLQINVGVEKEITASVDEKRMSALDVKVN